MKSIFLVALIFAAHLSAAADLNLSVSDKQTILKTSLEQIAAVHVDEHNENPSLQPSRRKTSRLPTTLSLQINS